MQPEELFGRLDRFLRRPGAAHRDAGLAKEPLLAPAQVLLAREPFQVLVPGALEGNVRADVAQARVAHHARRRAPRREALRELHGGKALPGDAVQVADVPGKLLQLLQAALQHLALAAGIGQHVEVVAARLAVADEGQPPHLDAAHAHPLGEEGQYPTSRPPSRTQRLASWRPSPKCAHQGQEPVRAEEHVPGARAQVQLPPLLGARLPHVHRDRRILDHARLAHRSSSRTQLATCSASAGERSWCTGSSRTRSRRRSTSGNAPAGTAGSRTRQKSTVSTPRASRRAMARGLVLHPQRIEERTDARLQLAGDRRRHVAEHGVEQEVVAPAPLDDAGKVLVAQHQVAGRAHAQLDVGGVEVLRAGGDALHLRAVHHPAARVAQRLPGAPSQPAGAQLQIREQAADQVRGGGGEPRRHRRGKPLHLAGELAADEERAAVGHRDGLVEAEHGHVAGGAQRLLAVAGEQRERAVLDHLHPQLGAEAAGPLPCPAGSRRSG